MLKMEECKKANTFEKNGEQELYVGYVVEVSHQVKDTHELLVTTEDKQNIETQCSAKSLPSEETEFNLIVFVGNLGEQVNETGVKEMFMEHAGILEDEIVGMNMLWKVKNYDKLLIFTFVKFTCENAYQRALKLNNFLHNGQNLLILPSVQTHCGLFHMEKKEKVECQKDEEEEEKREETKKNTDTDKPEEMGNFEQGVEINDSTVKVNENFESVEEIRDCTEKVKENFEQDEEIGERTDKVKENVEQDEEIVESTDKVKEIKKNCSSNGEYFPVYKKSGHVAYLKHLPPDVTEDEVLQLFNFTRSDIVDISVLKFSRGRKTSSKRSEVRAVIAFPSEENLEKCLAQSHKPFRNLWVAAERHGMAKSAPGDKRSFSPNALTDCTETISSPKRQALSDSFEKNSTDKTELDLFVKHINWNVSDRIIHDFFASVGATVQGITQLGDPGTKGRGMCFVTMADKESLLRGLALNGAVFLGNKIKVSIRKDRKFLASPMEDEMPPNYSTFIAKLPVKKSAESLKNALSKFLKKADCSVKRIFIPLADNHSGNRGYAFVTFEDEKSLTKAFGLNDSEIQICDNTVKITVSNHWPENLKGVRDAVLKNKDQDYKRNFDGDQEPSKSGKQLRRRRKGPSPHRGTLYKNQREASKKFARLGSNAFEYPLKQQQGFSNYNSYDSDYIAYLDYLEFRDYVAMRKAYNFSDYNTHQQPGSKDDFQQKQKVCQTFSPPVTQSYCGTNVTRTYQEPISESREGSRETGWRNYSSNISSRCGNDDVYNLPLSAPSTGNYDKFVQSSIPVSNQGYEKVSQTSLTSANCGYEKILQGCTAGSTSVSTVSRDLHHTVTRPSTADSKGSSVPIWASSSKRYTDKISTSPEWYGGNSQSCWKRREAEVLPQSTSSSGDSGNRGIKFPYGSVNYASERGNSVYAPQCSSPGPAHSPGIRCSKSNHDVGLYSRMDRRSSFSLGAGQNSLNSSHPGSTGGPSWLSSTTGSSTLSQTNVVYPYVEYPSSVTKRDDKQRKSADCEKSGSFINKLVSSGILSNAGYKLSVEGYHAN